MRDTPAARARSISDGASAAIRASCRWQCESNTPSFVPATAPVDKRRAFAARFAVVATALITGASGFLGREVVQFLVENDPSLELVALLRARDASDLEARRLRL